MQLIESVRIAISALTVNKLRSILTMLGIIMGVSAVITLMSVGRGLEQYVADQFAGLGSNLLFVVAGQIRDRPIQRTREVKPLTLGDAKAIEDRSQAPDVSAVASEWSGEAVLSYKGTDIILTVRGVTPEFAQVRNWKPRIGNFLTTGDYDQRSRVVVLAIDTYETLFGADEYPLEQTIHINNILFRVIGVMEEKGGGLSGNLDATAFIPLSTAQERVFRRRTISGDYHVTVIYASAVEQSHMDQAHRQITNILRRRRNISYLDTDDFSIVSQTDLISVFGDVLGALTIFLGVIAGISLLVGGIGIMNIMLVSVTERTREIGLRKAVGAKRRDILLQFLIEAIILAVSGGSVGILMGVAGTQTIGLLYDSFTAVVGVDAILLSLLFSMGVGVFFGIYPAYLASRLNPIDALRYE